MAVTNVYSVNSQIKGISVNDTFRSFSSDALGSTVAITDGNSDVLGTYSYTPYGTIDTESDTIYADGFLWVGTLGYQVSNDSRYIYVRTRHLLVPPVVYSSSAKGGYSRHQYTDNPVNVSSPLGLLTGNKPTGQNSDRISSNVNRQSDSTLDAPGGGQGSQPPLPVTLESPVPVPFLGDLPPGNVDIKRCLGIPVGIIPLGTTPFAVEISLEICYDKYDTRCCPGDVASYCSSLGLTVALVVGPNWEQFFKNIGDLVSGDTQNVVEFMTEFITSFLAGSGHLTVAGIVPKRGCVAKGRSFEFSLCVEACASVIAYSGCLHWKDGVRSENSSDYIMGFCGLPSLAGSGTVRMVDCY